MYSAHWELFAEAADSVGASDWTDCNEKDMSCSRVSDFPEALQHVEELKGVPWTIFEIASAKFAGIKAIGMNSNGTRRERLGHMTLRDDNCRHAGPGQTISQVARVDQMCEGCQTDTRSGSTTRSRNHAANAQNEIISVERREGATGPATAR